MIIVDSRVGSSHYGILLRDRCILGRLEAGDMAFECSGTSVGIECKRILDAVNCLYSGRLADEQIPKLRKSYDACYLVLEGLVQPGPEGELQYYKGELGKWGKWYDAHSGQKRLMYKAFMKWLLTLCHQGGVTLLTSVTPETTAALVLALEEWWGSDEHRSYYVMHQDEPTAALSRPTMLRRMLAEVPHVGWERSAILAKRFTGVRFLPNGDDPSAWLIERQIAEKSAKDIVEALSGSA